MMHYDDYGAQAARMLFEAFPWMREFAGQGESGDDGKCSLLIEYHPPPRREDCQFWISSAGHELTVGLGMFHTHFDWPRPEAAEFWPDPFEFIRDLIEERVLVMDRTRNGKWAGSKTVPREEALAASAVEEHNEIIIHSWSGALDRRVSPRSPRPPERLLDHEGDGR